MKSARTIIFKEKLFNFIFPNKVADLYSTRFRQYGPVPTSVLWFDNERQLKRFELIADSILATGFVSTDTLVDFGCGYGAFLDYLNCQRLITPAHYYGIDVSENMINFCRKRFVSEKVTFTKASYLNHPCSFSVISGTFNRAVVSKLAVWEAYVVSNLFEIWKNTKKSMVFNIQYTSSKSSKITDDMIYYMSHGSLSSLLLDLGGSSQLIFDDYLPNDVTVVVSKI